MNFYTSTTMVHVVTLPNQNSSALDELNFLPNNLTKFYQYPSMGLRGVEFKHWSSINAGKCRWHSNTFLTFKMHHNTRLKVYMVYGWKSYPRYIWFQLHYNNVGMLRMTLRSLNGKQSVLNICNIFRNFFHWFMRMVKSTGALT